MQRKQTHLRFFAAIIVLGATGWAQQIESMKLLAPNVGLVASKEKLFWTTDGGSHWKNVTPPRQASELIRNVFFLDDTHGWVLLDTYNADQDLHAFRIASTANCGETWDTRLVALPSQKPSLAGGGWLDFVDRTHGWMVLPAVTSSAFSWGLLLTTENGGVSWKELPPAPIAGPPVFVTTKRGWIYEMGGTRGAYQTDDGGAIGTAEDRICPTTRPTESLALPIRNTASYS